MQKNKNPNKSFERDKIENSSPAGGHHESRDSLHRGSLTVRASFADAKGFLDVNPHHLISDDNMKKGNFDLENDDKVHTIWRSGRTTPMADSVKVQVINKASIEKVEVDGPYAQSYTFRELLKIEIDPTYKMILFYNLACCY